MEKLLAIVGLTQKAYGRWLLQRFMLGATLVLGLTLMIGILISALVITLFYLLYVVLIFYSVAPLAALAVVTLTAMAFIALLIYFTLRYVKRLRRMQSSIFEKAPTGSRITDTISAFFDGLTKG